MSLVKGKKTYLLKDIWVAYAQSLVKEYPGTKSKRMKSISMYSVYRRINGRNVEIMNYGRFRKIVEYWIDKAKTAIIKGEAVDIYGGVGKICARRVERDWSRHLLIDWHKTQKQPLVWNEEKKRHEYKNKIYFGGDDWSRIGWNRSKTLTNETYYEFKPTDTNTTRGTGFKREFAAALLKDPLLKYQYLYFPLSTIKNRNKKKKDGIRSNIDQGGNRPDHNGNGSAGHTDNSGPGGMGPTSNGTYENQERTGEEMGRRDNGVPQSSASL